MELSELGTRPTGYTLGRTSLAGDAGVPSERRVGTSRTRVGSGTGVPDLQVLGVPSSVFKGYRSLTPNELFVDVVVYL